MRQVTQALHEIAEKLATKEIELNPKDFVQRETISRGMNKMNSSDTDNLFVSFADNRIDENAGDQANGMASD